MRGTTRDRRSCPEIEAAGAEPYLGDPDRIASLAPALEHVSVACLLLGSAVGSADQLSSLHGTRLEMMLQRMIDTTVRGIVYEASGTVDPSLLAAGVARVSAACERSRIPYVLLDTETTEPAMWVRAASSAVTGLLGERDESAVTGLLGNSIE